MSAIEITRQDLSISQLRAEAARTADAKQARRILAIAWCWMVIRAVGRAGSAMDRQTHATGYIATTRMALAGLTDRPRPGRQPRLAEPSGAEVRSGVEDGPDLKNDGVVRWRCADLRDDRRQFNVHLP